MQDKAKAERIRQHFAPVKHDALIAFSIETTCYLSDVYNDIQRLVPERISIVVWRNGSNPVYIAHVNEVAQVKKEGWISDIRVYNEINTKPMGLLSDTLKDLVGLSGSVGIEKRALSADYYDELKELLPNFQFVDAASTFDGVRAVKTPDELRRLETAAQATDHAIRTALLAAKPGVTERQVGLVLYETLMNGGAEKAAHQFLGAATNSLLTHPRPGSYVLRDGDTIRVDAGGIFPGGYMSDVSRTMCAGKPSSRQLSTYRTIWDELERLISMLRPGVTCREIFESHKGRWAEIGWPMVRPHIGHNLGISDHETPTFSPFDETPLEPGMCMAVEPNHIVADVEKYHIEDVAVVTDSGSRVISRTADWENLLSG